MLLLLLLSLLLQAAPLLWSMGSARVVRLRGVSCTSDARLMKSFLGEEWMEGVADELEDGWLDE